MKERCQVTTNLFDGNLQVNEKTAKLKCQGLVKTLRDLEVNFDEEQKQHAAVVTARKQLECDLKEAKKSQIKVIDTLMQDHAVIKQLSQDLESVEQDRRAFKAQCDELVKELANNFNKKLMMIDEQRRLDTKSLPTLNSTCIVVT